MLKPGSPRAFLSQERCYALSALPSYVAAVLTACVTLYMLYIKVEWFAKQAGLHPWEQGRIIQGSKGSNEPGPPVLGGPPRARKNGRLRCFVRKSLTLLLDSPDRNRLSISIINIHASKRLFVA